MRWGSDVWRWSMVLRALYELGQHIDKTEGIQKAFKSDYKQPKEGDNVLVVSINDEKEIELDLKEVPEGIDIYEKSLYYKGGNDGVGNNTSISGISPFFFKIKDFNRDNGGIKISKGLNSNKKEGQGYNIEYFEKIYLDDIEKYGGQYLGTWKELKNNNVKNEFKEYVGRRFNFDCSNMKIETSNNNKIIFNNDEEEMEVLLGDFLDEEGYKNATIKHTSSNGNTEIGLLLTKEKNNERKLYVNKIEDYLSFVQRKKNKIKSKIENEIETEIENIKWIFFDELYGECILNLQNDFLRNFSSKPVNVKYSSPRGKCDICSKDKQTVNPNLDFFNLDKKIYLKNYTSLENLSLSDIKSENMRIKICPECNSYIVGGWKYLYNIFNKNYIVLPIVKKEKNEEGSLKTFLETVRGEDISNFEKINEAIDKDKINDNLELHLLIYSSDRNGFKNIEKIIRNYKLHSLQFDPKENEQLRLLENDDQTLRYINYSNQNYDGKRKVEDYFDIEAILKTFFINNSGFSLPFYFYELYFRDPPKNMNAKIKHLLYKYRDDLVSFIYGCDISAINRNILNDISLTSILYEIRNKRNIFKDPEYRDLNLRNDIIEKINNYYFLKEEIINKGEKNMIKQQIEKLEKHFENFEDEDRENIKKIVVEDGNKQLLYYLIGNFIQKIDNTRGRKGKNKIFENFVSNLNQRNIKDRFQKDILQGQNYYIKDRSQKAKFVLDLIKYHLDDLFEDLSYDDVIISIITGYYSEDILETEKPKKKD